MSVLDFRPLPPRSDRRGFCTNGCQTQSAAGGTTPRMATHALAGLGHPQGQFCDSCKATMQKEWARARMPEVAA